MHKILSLTVIFISLSAQAVTLSWDECLKFTSEGNPLLEATHREWLAAKQTENAIWGRYLPSLSATTSAIRSGSPGGAGAIVTNGVVINTAGSQVNTNYQGQLNFNQNLFNGLEDKARINQAQWQTKNSFWKYISTKASVSYSLKEAFANLKYAQELKDLSQSILDRRESNYKLVSVRYESGRENKGSVLLSEAYMEQARLDLIKARDSLKVAQASIKSLMNKEHLEDITITGEIPLPEISPDRNDFDTLVVETPAYNQAYTTEMAADEGIRIARGSFMPDLNLTSLVSRQGESYFPNRDRERWSIALTLTIPIFDGLKDLGTYRSSVESKYASESRKKSTMLDLIPKLKDALNLAKQSDIKYSIDNKFEQAASSRAEIARKKYNNGLLTFEDWDIIESELITRQMNFLASKRDRILKYANWENLLGKGSIP